MPGQFPYERRHKYPHMLGEDVPVWERFIGAFPDRFDSVDYDWRVGTGVLPDPGWDEATARMARMLSQKRIDVIGWVGESPTIIEVKDRCGLSALGQIRGYRALFRRDFPDLGDPAILIVCGRLDRDDRAVLAAEGVPVEVV